MLSRSVMNFIYYFVFVIITFFFAPFLVSKGFDQLYVGRLQTIGLLVTIILFLFNGAISDKIKSNKKVILVNLCISLLSLMILIFSNSINTIGLMFILILATFNSTAPILDSLVLQDIDVKHYGTIRGIGSFGAALSFILSSFYLGNVVLIKLMWLLLFLILILFIMSLRITETYKNKKNINYFEGIKYIIKNKEVLFLFLITIITYGVLKADDPYSVNYNTQVVLLSSLVYGLSNSISTILEGIFMSLNIGIIKVGKYNVFLLSTFVLLLIFITRGFLFEYPLLITIGNTMFGIFIGLFVPTVIKSLNSYSTEDNRATIFGMYQISIYIGGVVFGTITNVYLRTISTDDYLLSLPNIYKLHSIIIICAIVFIIFFKKLMIKKEVLK